MGITIVAIGTGLLIGFLMGGRVRNLAQRHFRLGLVFAAGIGFQLVVTYGPSDVPVAVLLLSYTCLLTFAVANLDLRGMGLIAIGIALNFTVIAVNRGMPVDPRAVRAAGVYSEAEMRTHIIEGKRHLQHPGEDLLWLSDIIPASLPGNPQVVSFGDLILYFGVAALMANLLRPARRGVEGQARLPDADYAGLEVADPPIKFDPSSR